MGQIFITDLKIEKVRHLKDISIPLSKEEIKHLILTGKNGSGKTSVIEALAGYLNDVFTNQFFTELKKWLNNAEEQRNCEIQRGEDEAEISKLQKDILKKRKMYRKAETVWISNSILKRVISTYWQRDITI